MLFMALSRYSAISNIAGNGMTVKTTRQLILGSLYFNYLQIGDSITWMYRHFILASVIIGICMALPESFKFGMYDLHAMNPTRFPDHYTICTNKMSENEIKALSIGIFVV